MPSDNSQLRHDVRVRALGPHGVGVALGLADGSTRTLPEVPLTVVRRRQELAAGPRDEPDLGTPSG